MNSLVKQSNCDYKRTETFIVKSLLISVFLFHLLSFLPLELFFNPSNLISIFFCKEQNARLLW